MRTLYLSKGIAKTGFFVFFYAEGAKTNGLLRMFKALFLALFFSASAAWAQTSEEADAFARATDELFDGDWAGAQAWAARSGPVAIDIIEWHRLRAGRGTWADASAFLERRGDWPGLRLLRRKTEARLPIGRSPQEVLEFFAGQPPQTGFGARALIAAHRAQGNVVAAEDELVLAWRTMLMTSADETALLNAYASVLKDHHTARLDMLLWRGATKSAERMLPRVGKDWRALAKARLALRANSKGVDTLIEAVPKSLQADPGLAFERMQWRARKGRSEDAIEVILASGADTLGQPARWAGWRRAFARSEMRAGRIGRAYKLASEHGLSDGSHFADLEWLSGYLALTYMEDGDAALTHFQRFRGAVETPISLGRAGYWEGRAHEFLKDAENARHAYAFGAEYQTSFYGLLAAERLGREKDESLAGRTAYPPLSETSFAERGVFKAAQLFIATDQRNLAEQFVRHMTETLPRDEIGTLGDFVLAQNEPHLAVMIGKQAARRGIVLPRAYYPVASLGVIHMPVPRELALAIARRESEFDPAVTSGADARGLMQLLPSTAKAVARDLEIRYSTERLLTDPAFNARLGTAYLDELMSIFDGNVVMTAAGYNAGPGRPIRWMKRFGDPRKGEIAIVDWIEHIPFDETRNYVMRVAESLPVYRARLTGSAGLTLTEELIARPGHTRSAQKGEFIRPKPRPKIPLPLVVDASPEPQGEAQPSLVRPRPRPSGVESAS
ncbi:MAG: lytic transglycosylase domain-containing protein [Pseudomonadota bacterium]